MTPSVSGPTPSVSGPTPSVSGLFVYPIKSCGGFALDEVLLEPRGFRHDRRWLIVAPDGVALTQRDDPRMASLRPRVTDEGLRVEAPGRDPVDVRPAPGGDRIEVDVWGTHARAVPVVPAADAWISDFLGRPARFVHMDESVHRIRDAGDYPAHEVSFADREPVLLAGEASLEELNRRSDHPIPMSRFRPNLVLAGTAPFAEDDWTRITVGEVELDVVQPAARCVVVTIDQDTGRRDPDAEPLRSLATFRNVPGEGVFFGVRAAVVKAGTLRVGDEVSGRAD